VVCWSLTRRRSGNSKRKNHSPEFKAKVPLEALNEVPQKFNNLRHALNLIARSVSTSITTAHTQVALTLRQQNMLEDQILNRANLN